MQTFLDYLLNWKSQKKIKNGKSTSGWHSLDLVSNFLINYYIYNVVVCNWKIQEILFCFSLKKNGKNLLCIELEIMKKKTLKFSRSQIDFFSSPMLAIDEWQSNEREKKCWPKHSPLVKACAFHTQGRNVHMHTHMSIFFLMCGVIEYKKRKTPFFFYLQMIRRTRKKIRITTHTSLSQK